MGEVGKVITKPCELCKANKVGVVKVFSMEMCPDCHKEMKNTLQCLKASTDWVLRMFDTHETGSKPLTLRSKAQPKETQDENKKAVDNKPVSEGQGHKEVS